MEFKFIRGWKPKEYMINGCNRYEVSLNDIFQLYVSEDFFDLDSIIAETAKLCIDESLNSSVMHVAWRNEEIKRLINLRRNSRNVYERVYFSKSVWKKLRSGNRRWKISQMNLILKEFQDLGRLHQMYRMSIIHERRNECSKDSLTDLFREVYRSIYEIKKFKVEQIRIKRKYLDVFVFVLRRMKNRRCTDREGIVVEMIKHGGRRLYENIVLLYNKILDDGDVYASWKDLFHNGAQIR